MLRNTVLAVATLVLGLTTLVPEAQANSAAQCAAMLDDVEAARTSLEQLELSLVEVDAERRELVTAIAAIDAKLVGTTGAAMLTLRAERDALANELTLIDELRPSLVRQVEALRTSVDESERGYIACIETAIDG